ncbi:DUF3240 family protein [Thalassotalea sp. M1531]|uniref:DUF3240 family protein n=1 Tax=Thalassotalea algicola TaxID=2716224 RepID=A0A7Y0Q6M5_9GAMM|nr:DUF3240 family protein [Thalassotalea algicola]NMP31533.1 DUF3240 family protein [Thalassotalea algicola]
MSDHQVKFTLITPNELKDDIIDCLMKFDLISGFNLSTINGFSKEHHCFNIEEQVQGFKQLSQFDIIIAEIDKQALINELSKVTRANKLKYWVVPLNESAHLNEK